MVTGAGSGIGLATVRELAARGARGVILVGRPGNDLETSAARLNAPALSVCADVSDAAAMADAVIEGR